MRGPTLAHRGWGQRMGRQGIRIGIVGVAAGSLLLAACSSGTTSGPSSSAPAAQSAGASVQPTASLDASAAEVAAFTQLDPAEQEKQLAAASAEAEGALVPAADSAAYTAVSDSLVTAARTYLTDPAFGKFGAGPVAAGDAGFGGMTFAGWMITSLALSSAVGATNDLKAGEPAQSVNRNDSSGNNTSDMTISGSTESASIDWKMGSTEKGMTGSVHLKGKINPCPDVNGVFTAKVTLDTEGVSDTGTGRAATSVDIELTGLVDESANIVGYETKSNNKAKSGARGQVADITSTTTYGPDGVSAATRGANEAAGATAQESSQWGFLGMMTETMVTDGIVKAIKQGIESGRCVQLNAPTTPSKTSGLKPSTPVSINAQPRSKVDGKPTGGTVTGQLEGGSSLDPSGTAVDADATFAYIAPDKEDDRASVALVSRSIRGVGKAKVPFDTVVVRGYAIGQRIAPYLFTATNCGSAAGPWVIHYELEDMPGIKGGGDIKLTFPSEPAPGDEDTVVKTTGTDAGELKAVGLPGGVRFNGPAKATMQRFGAHLKLVITTSGTTTGYARGKQRNGTERTDKFQLIAQAASATECPTQ